MTYCSPTVSCNPPSAQGVVTDWDDGTTDYGASPESLTQGQFIYNGGQNKSLGDRVKFEDGKVKVYPSCTYLPDPNNPSVYRLELRNMCPSLRSSGDDCRGKNKCTFSANTCPATSSTAYSSTSNNTGECIYDVDLIQSTSDVSYLLRSSALGIGSFPIAAAGRLVDNWSARLEAMTSPRVTSSMKADAWCMAVKHKTIGPLQRAKTDFREVVDSFSSDWGPVYWGQLAWAARILSSKTDDIGTGAVGQGCSVGQNCSCGEWNEFRL